MSHPHTCPAAGARPPVETLLARASTPVRRLLDHALAGGEVGRDDAEALFSARGDDLQAVLAAADLVRQQTVGDGVTFVTTRNINFTNVCYMACQFCNFGVRKDAPGAELLPLDTIADRAEEAWRRGASEVCIQGGLHPELDGDHYRRIVEAVKTRVSGIHVHAFSPFEIWYGAAKRRMPERDFLIELQTAGLGSIPGTAAEILDTEIRRQLTRNKLSADKWEEIVRAAHSIGLRSTATIMYGHIDGPRHWAAHIDRIRAIQKDTGGFTEFVPLGFIHEKTRLYRDHPSARPGPVEEENLAMHAVARLMLKGWIDNIQVSWVKLGPEMAQTMLACGANDLGGTLMNESISRAAGARHGQEVTPAEMVRIIRAAGRVPARRNTLYGIVERFDDHDPDELQPLVPRADDVDPTAFMKRHKALERAGS